MSRKFPTGVDLQNQRAINLASPSATTDAANKAYVDNRVDGLAYKDEVRAASTTNGALATAYAAGQTLDGLTLATGDRILLKDQSTGSENGIYVVAASGAPTRSTDSDTTADLNNATVYVTDGTVNSGREYTQTAKNPTVGTTALVFAQKTTGITYAAGNGLSLAGTTFAVNPGSGILADGTSTRIDPAYSGLAKRYAIDVAAGSTSVTITHNLGTQDHAVEVYLKSTGEVVEPDILLGVNADSLTFGTAPTSGQYRFVAIG